MTSKRKPKKKPDTDQLIVHTKPGEDFGLATARLVLRPTVQAAATLKEYDKNYGELKLNHLINALAEQTEASNDGEWGELRPCSQRRPIRLTRYSITWQEGQLIPST